MQIKEDGGRNYLATVLSFLGRVVWNRKVYIIVLLLIFLAGLALGAGATGFLGPLDNPSPRLRSGIDSVLAALGMSEAEAYNIAVGIKNEHVKIPVNYVRGLFANPEHLDISIAFEDYQRITYKREQALLEGRLSSTDEDFVPAQVTIGGETVDVKVRLKGLFSDHWSGDKWSLRVKTRNDASILGMEEFSLQDPRTRNYLYEWVFHEAIRREGIVAPRYFFVDVSINGKHKGVYALEEHIDKLLVENNEQREGPVVRYATGEIFDAFQTGRIVEDSVQYQEFIRAKDLLRAFNSGELPASEVFDAPKLARYMALCDVMSATHALLMGNLKFYYNPVTAKLEPIAFDASAVRNYEYLIYEYEHPYYSKFVAEAFRDPDFFKYYLQELERMAEPAYLGELFDAIADGLHRQLSILYADSPYFHFSRDIFYTNQATIHDKLERRIDIPVFFDGYSGNGVVTLEIGNSNRMPVELLGLTCRDTGFFQILQPGKVIYNRDPAADVSYEKLGFVLPEGLTWDDGFIADLELNYTLLGSSEVQRIAVVPYARTSTGLADLVSQPASAADFDFLSVDEAGRRILAGAGRHVLDRSLVVPEGYAFCCLEGAQLHLEADAVILSYSPLRLLGSAQNPVVIEAAEDSRSGIVVIGAGDRSIIENTVFRGLAAPGRPGWGVTGAVTFYESPVDFSDCRFETNRGGDDMVNIIRSGFSIGGCVFTGAFADALDIDFGEGAISDTSFVDCGNDGVDLSGSDVAIIGCRVNGAGDKGLSVGERSHVLVRDSILGSCYIGIASKDMSVVTVQDVTVAHCQVGLAAYQKKPAFGPAEIRADATIISAAEWSYLAEEDSVITSDGRSIDNYYQDVYAILYGVE